MTEQAAAGAAGAERPIMFRDRELWVKFPSEEQILVYSRTLKMLQSPDVESWDGPQVLKALDRTLRIVLSVLINRGDAEWLEDLMLDGDLKLVDACEIVNMTIKAFEADGQNRATKRRAARRKVEA